MKTTADIMSLANDYANADNVIDSAQKQQALRLAVDAALSAPAWPMRGVRVEDDKVIVTVKGGNDAARWLCGELVALIDARPVMTDLRTAAQALVARWDTPLWKDAPHTGKYIDALRQALAVPPIGSDLYERLHALSKQLEGSGRIDEHEHPGAYATILDAMAAEQAHAALSVPAGWIPVSKGLPGVDQARCFVIAPKASQGDLWPTKWCLDGQVFEAAFGGFFEPSEVTYWMYAADLPAAPSPQEPTDV